MSNRRIARVGLLVAALCMTGAAGADNFLKGLINDVVGDGGKASGNKDAGGGREVEDLVYYQSPQITPRWRVNSYTPETLNGYHHLRIGANAPNRYRPNDAYIDADVKCETRLLAAAWWDVEYSLENLRKFCTVHDAGVNPTAKYIDERISYFEGKNKFYFRAGSRWLDVRWNNHLQATVVSIAGNLIDSPQFDANGQPLSRFILEGNKISNEFWSTKGNYSEATGNTKPMISNQPMFQTTLTNDRKEFPSGSLLNTVFFTITGQPRYVSTDPKGVKTYAVPVTVDRIEIADRNVALVIEDVRK